MPERLDWIEVALSRDTVTLPWASRDSLLEQFTRGTGKEIRTAFEASGASRPVKLTLEQKAELVRVIETWHRIVGGYGGLPAGVFNLRNALLDDLADAARGVSAD
jgi:hypothetical protein